MTENTQTQAPKILLASSSKYRANMLKTLGLSFEQASPNINEQAIDFEDAESLAVRLSIEKAQALVSSYSQHVIIASDQVAQDERGNLIGKPHSIENAFKQLKGFSNSTVVFNTGLCVLSPLNIKLNENRQDSIIQTAHCINSANKYSYQYCLATAQVKFRKLSDTQIKSYISRDMPLDCAGSFKSEGLGISLFEYIRCDDPNILVGLPMIQLCTALSNIGIDI